MQTFGQVIPVLGPNVGFPGQWSRTADSIIVARPVNSATNLPFGAGAVLIGSATGGTFQSLADFLATATNAQNLQAYFAGIAVRNVKVMAPYSALTQSPGTVVATTASQATIGQTTITVASATGIVIGQSVEGFGIAANTLVTGISGTTITISLPTTGVLSTTNVTFTSVTAPAVGYFATGLEGEVLVRSSITVLITNGTPQAGGAVYVRTVANASIAGTSVGDFEASNDVATNSLTYGCTIGSATFTTSAATGLAPGQYVSGPGIPANTYIVSGATTSWVFSNPATATIASGAALVASNTGILGSAVDPWIKFRTGQLDANNIAEVLIANRHAA
jgi:hypothetical protein